MNRRNFLKGLASISAVAGIPLIPQYTSLLAADKIPAVSPVGVKVAPVGVKNYLFIDGEIILIDIASISVHNVGYIASPHLKWKLQCASRNFVDISPAWNVDVSVHMDDIVVFSSKADVMNVTHTVGPEGIEVMFDIEGWVSDIA